MNTITYVNQLIGGFCYRLKSGSTPALDCLTWTKFFKILCIKAVIATRLIGIHGHAYGDELILLLSLNF